jgi:lambda family phage portal protein
MLLDQFFHARPITTPAATPTTPATKPRASKAPAESEQIETLRARLDSERRKNGGAMSRFDAAQTTDENKNHWAQADGLSATAANSVDVRYRLRTRSRYEVANNGYASRIVRRRANDTIGTGPRLQLSLPETFTVPEFPDNELTTPPDAAQIVEAKWREWCLAINLADKLRTMDRAETTDGESFAVEINNSALPPEGVQLDIRLYEADQVTTPNLTWNTPNHVDGIRFDDAGNPVEYHLLRQHPGDQFTTLNNWDYERIPARRVYHFFEELRPGQKRGIPGLTPGLPLYAIMRRFTLASLLSAEWGACIAGVIENDNSPPQDSEEEADELEVMDKVPIPRNALLTLGGGQKAHAFDSKQPGPGYKEFKSEVLTESGSSISAPRNVSTGSSAEYNYSSGRLDLLPWQDDIGIRRDGRERLFLYRLFRSWYREARLIRGYLPEDLPPVETWTVAWYWDGFASIDPEKDANARAIKKQSGLLTDAEALAEEGKDWREHYRQLAREKAERERLGLPEPTPSTTPKPANQPAPAGVNDA